MRRITLRGLLARKLRLALTALAIVLGVTFVTGTLVLGDTLNRTVNNLIGSVYQHVNFEIRGKAAFKDNSPAAVTGTSDRKPVPASLAAEVRRLPGVAYVFGTAGGYAQLVAPDGSSIDDGAGKNLGFAFDPNRQLSPFRLVAGRAPGDAARRGDRQGHGDQVPLRAGRCDSRLAARRGAHVHAHRDRHVRRRQDARGRHARGLPAVDRTSAVRLPRPLRRDQRAGRPGGGQRRAAAGDRPAAAGRGRGRERAGRGQPAEQCRGRRALVPVDRAADLRADLAVRGRLHDLQHVHDHGRAAHP